MASPSNSELESPTPLSVRGKKRKASSQDVVNRKTRLTSTLTDTPILKTAPITGREQATERQLSKLETLPLEILQMIMSYGPFDKSFFQASGYLSMRLSSDYVYYLQFKQVFENNVRLRRGQQVIPATQPGNAWPNPREVAMLQKQLVLYRWFTYERFQEFASRLELQKTADVTSHDTSSQLNGSFRLRSNGGNGSQSQSQNDAIASLSNVPLPTKVLKCPKKSSQKVSLEQIKFMWEIKARARYVLDWSSNLLHVEMARELVEHSLKHKQYGLTCMLFEAFPPLQINPQALIHHALRTTRCDHLTVAILAAHGLLKANDVDMITRTIFRGFFNAGWDCFLQAGLTDVPADESMSFPEASIDFVLSSSRSRTFRNWLIQFLLGRLV